MSSTQPTTLYEVLGVPRTCTEAEITKAYRVLALKYHPDRNPDGADMFKKVNDAYNVLRDQARRGIYDATGSTGAGDDGANAFEPMSEEDTARRFAELSTEIEQFYETYVGSPEEVQDAIKSYETTRGNFRSMIREYLIFDNSEPTEVRRLRDLVQTCIDEGKIDTATKRWTKTSSDSIVAKLEAEMDEERDLAEEEVQTRFTHHSNDSCTTATAAAVTTQEGGDSPPAGNAAEHQRSSKPEGTKKKNKNKNKTSGGGDGEHKNLLQMMISSRQKQLSDWDNFTDKLMSKYCSGGNSEGEEQEDDLVVGTNDHDMKPRKKSRKGRH